MFCIIQHCVTVPLSDCAGSHSSATRKPHAVPNLLLCWIIQHSFLLTHETVITSYLWFPLVSPLEHALFCFPSLSSIILLFFSPPWSDWGAGRGGWMHQRHLKESICFKTEHFLLYGVNAAARNTLSLRHSRAFMTTTTTTITFVYSPSTCQNQDSDVCYQLRESSNHHISAVSSAFIVSESDHWASCWVVAGCTFHYAGIVHMF